ncbi:MAG: bifunctional UDP-N-acetylglucosamine diphosphorylase/glucosamine-1-phosphate N-acetyltransferase GlmU [Vicinamibacterales bacterium]
MSQIHVVILAAGQGTRMKSELPKVLHKVAGSPMIRRVLRTAAAISPETVTLVVGHKAQLVRDALADVDGLRFAVQAPQLGTAHALQQAEPLLKGRSGTLILLSGDVPLLRPETLRRLLAAHESVQAAATVVTATVARPRGYGRIVRENGRIARIVEEKDASDDQRRIQEINSGIYAFDLAPLFEALRAVASGNAQGEFYLTDLVGIYRQRNLPVETCLIDAVDEIRGINSRSELAEMSRVVRQSKNEELMAAGVTLVDPATTYIDPDVQIGADTVIHPGVVLEGHTRIGSACEIQPHVRIVDSEIADHVAINSFCLIVGSRVAAKASIGPFAHLRPETIVGEAARVGNFVELKKTTLGPGAKANHLAYLGDATIGAKANIGAGTITCNYDGKNKHATIIEDGAFIGSDTQLVAPVRIGKGAVVGAGTTVREDVPAGALAVSAGKQRNIEGWVERKRSATPGK